MLIKNNVRQRRQDRIKSLVEEHREPRELLHKAPYSARHDERLEDPEYVWKSKQKIWEKDDLLTEEERWKQWNTQPTANQLTSKLVLCVFLFASVWGMFQWEHPIAERVQGFIGNALTKDFEFKKAALWYNEFFQGSPAFIPAFDKYNNTSKVDASWSNHYFAPAGGKLVYSFSQADKGVYIETLHNAGVSSFDTGRVIYVGELKNTGLTVIIQHARHLQSIYGGLGQTSLQENDWVKGGQTIGNVSQRTEDGRSLLFFAVKLENNYIDPADVIAFD